MSIDTDDPVISASAWPSVSVVVPMRNEAQHVTACLEALALQDYPSERFEIIVADGESTDGSTEIVRRFARDDSRIRLCPNPHRTTPFGLNAGIRAATGEVIVILGAHAFVEPDFVRESVAALQRSGADVAGGVMEAIGQDAFGEAVAEAVCSRFGVGSVAFRQATTEQFVDTAAFAAYRRETLERVGLFDEEMVRDQDDELNYRIRASGGRIFLTPRIRSTYAARTTPRRLWKQYFAYGYYKVRVLQKHPRMMQPRHFAPALAVIFGAGTLAAAVKDRRAFILIAPVATVYAAGITTASVRAARRIGWSRLPALFTAFPILHMSYGAGFLLGMVRFMSRWWTAEPPAPALHAISSGADHRS
jgi:succinoglycan biosynthesis protein ExoA